MARFFGCRRIGHFHPRHRSVQGTLDLLELDSLVARSSIDLIVIREDLGRREQGDVARRRLELDAQTRLEKHGPAHEAPHRRIEIALEITIPVPHARARLPFHARRKRRPADPVVAPAPAHPGGGPYMVGDPDPSVAGIEQPAAVVVRRPPPRLVGHPGPPVLRVRPAAIGIGPPTVRNIVGCPRPAVRCIGEPVSVGLQLVVEERDVRRGHRGRFNRVVHGLLVGLHKNRRAAGRSHHAHCHHRESNPLVRHLTPPVSSGAPPQEGTRRERRASEASARNPVQAGERHPARRQASGLEDGKGASQAKGPSWRRER